MEKLPWLEYTGQTTEELLACKNSHRIDSLLCAFEQGLQTKLNQDGHETITDPEWLVLAVRALDREVNNGGYQQFFLNSSVQFAPIILDCLLRIHCTTIAAITEKAIAALGVVELSADAASEAIYTEDPVRDAVLADCDNQFYKLTEIESNLFSFVEAHQSEIQLAKEYVALRPEKIPASSKVGTLRELVQDLSEQRIDSGNENAN
jgi:hypothetical protein